MMELWAFFTGPWEWIIVMVVLVLLFGRRLPEVGRSLGRGIVEFKKGVKGVEDEIEDAAESTPPAPPATDTTPAEPTATPSSADAPAAAPGAADKPETPPRSPEG